MINGNPPTGWRLPIVIGRPPFLHFFVLKRPKTFPVQNRSRDEPTVRKMEESKNPTHLFPFRNARRNYGVVAEGSLRGQVMGMVERLAGIV